MQKTHLTQDEYAVIRAKLDEGFLNGKQIAVVTKRSEQTVSAIKRSADWDDYVIKNQPSKMRYKPAVDKELFGEPKLPSNFGKVVIAPKDKTPEHVVAYYAILDQVDAIRKELEDIKSQLEAINYLMSK